jgi:hypothetical protein
MVQGAVLCLADGYKAITQSRLELMPPSSIGLSETAMLLCVSLR